MIIKRFYQSYNAVKYSIPMTSIAFLIFIEAFIYTGRREPVLRLCMILTTIVLSVIMFLYYRNKFKISKVLKKIQDIDAYEKGGCVDRSWFLEDRMLISDGKNIGEHSVYGIQKLKLDERNHGKYFLHITQSEKEYDISLTDRESGQRLTSFFIRKNPGINYENIQPKGSGTLKELGADK